MSEQFSRKRRLVSSREYQWIYRTGKKYIGKHITIFYRLDGEKGARLGITVARKWGTAPQRNRFKRIVRSAYRAFLFEPTAQLEMNVHPRPDYQSLTMTQVQQDMDQFFAKICVSPQSKPKKSCRNN